MIIVDIDRDMPDCAARITEGEEALSGRSAGRVCVLHTATTRESRQ
jgi:hypothetical protein